ncbi:glycoside hydrolase family 65 protein [Paenibacillus septentrionalis]|uniref:Glycoside hydrolase family 65 protein n=1 Tax=Paenibacillus septentrionalis TaxID=429342 RepID=A0ABW1V4L7_9BACL
MTWSIINQSLEEADLLNQESIYALGNGYLGVRGNFEEGYAGRKSIRGTYLNAFHDVINIPYGEKLYGFPSTQQKLVNVIDAQGIDIYVGAAQEHFNLFSGEVVSYTREMKLNDGYTERVIHWKSPSGQELKLRFRRLVSFKTRELFAIDIAIEPISVNGEITIVSTVQGDVENYTAVNDPRVASGHAKLLTTQAQGSENGVDYVQNETLTSKLSVSCAAAYSHSGAASSEHVTEGNKINYKASFSSNSPLSFTKWNVYTDTLRHGEQSLQQAIHIAADLASSSSFEAQLKEQKQYLDDFWYRSDIVISNDEALQEGIRFNIYQLLQSAGRDEYSNIAAKGLSGEGYEGHYFWDTEIYMAPVFLLTQPDIAKQLLIYRHHILPFARQRAKEMGHAKGALYPWRTISGTECSSFFPSGTAQYHISADIAYSYIQYFMATEDVDFLADYGCEVLAETARLWIEVGHEHEGSFYIDEVTGPDEYTCCVNNNYYTNAMAKHNLAWAAKAMQLLQQASPERYAALIQQLELTADEITVWANAAERMYLPYDEALGINPQDDSFLRKKVWDFENTPEENYPLLLHYHPLTIYRYQVCKQADTVLAHFLLEDQQSLETIKQSFDYYEKITTHDSSLSTCIFSIMASKIGYDEKAYHYFQETARLDLDNTHGNTKDGLHLANMGGTWMAIVFGFAGVRIKPDTLSLAPKLPSDWDHYQFKLQYKQRTIEVTVAASGITLTLLAGEALTVELFNQPVVLQPNQSFSS